MRRQTALSIVVATSVVFLLGWYLAYTQKVVRDLRAESKRISQMCSTVYSGLGDTTADADVNALVDLSRMIREAGVPLVVTDASGTPAQCANLPPSITTMPAPDCGATADAA